MKYFALALVLAGLAVAQEHVLTPSGLDSSRYLVLALFYPGALEGLHPQPYTGQDITATMMRPVAAPCDSPCLPAMACGRARHVLRMTENRPGENQVVHVWRVRQYVSATGTPGPDATQAPPSLRRHRLDAVVISPCSA